MVSELCTESSRKPFNLHHYSSPCLPLSRCRPGCQTLLLPTGFECLVLFLSPLIFLTCPLTIPTNCQSTCPTCKPTSYYNSQAAYPTCPPTSHTNRHLACMTCLPTSPTNCRIACLTCIPTSLTNSHPACMTCPPTSYYKQSGSQSECGEGSQKRRAEAGFNRLCVEGQSWLPRLNW